MSCEVLIATSGVRNLIREGKNHQLYSAMQTGSKYGMQTMDASLVELIRKGEISREQALKKSSNPDEIERLMGGGGMSRNGAAASGAKSSFGRGR